VHGHGVRADHEKSRFSVGQRAQQIEKVLVHRDPNP
jgi:hypothetical protein